jgi:hypothetical protein
MSDDFTDAELDQIGDRSIIRWISDMASDQGIALNAADVREITDNVVMYISALVLAIGFVIEHPERA